MGNVISITDFDVEKIKSKNDFYRNKLKEIRTFQDLPFTTKSELLESQLKTPPYGDFQNNGELVEQVYRTSGTTSKPLLLSFSKFDVNYITDVGADCFIYSGMGEIGNQEVVINCLNLSMWAGGFFDAQSMIKTGVQVINFGTGNTNELIKLILDLHKKLKVSIHCTPSYLPVIEKKLETDFFLTPPDLNLWKIYLGAEGGIENNSFRQNLINKWDSKVFNANYGMSEICSIMASADNNNVLKFSEKLFQYYYIELLSPEGSIANILDAKINDEGELVFTSIFKQSQPLIRYRTKEKIRITDVKGATIHFEILGRDDDMLVVKGINFFPEQLRHLISQFKDLTGLYQLQVHKDQNGMINHINLICELSSSAHDTNNQTLRQNIISLIKNEFTISLDVNFVYKFEVIGNKLKSVNFIEEK